MGELGWNWNNIKTAPNRWMAYWLRRQGWVCFYLEERARHCGTHKGHFGSSVCWLALYQEGERRGREVQS
jgi:hypothetical protein